MGGDSALVDEETNVHQGELLSGLRGCSLCQLRCTGGKADDVGHEPTIGKDAVRAKRNQVWVNLMHSLSALHAPIPLSFYI